MSRKGKIPSNAVNRPKTNTYPKHYEVSDDNIFTIIISPKPWHPIFATQVDKIILSTCDIISKPLPIAFQVNSRASKVGSLTERCGSDFRNTRIGRLTLRGLFHQKMYITKFTAAYARVTISRWVIGRCSIARAMHCITNHDV